MAGGINRLSARRVELLKTPGRYSDGGGLYLRVTDKSKSWVFRWTVADASRPSGRREREMGFGATNAVSLQAARERAALTRSQVAARADPFEELKRKERDREAAALKAKEPTFRNAAVLYHEELAPTHKRKKHHDAWLSTLELYAYPHFGDRLVSEVDQVVIRNALLPIWIAKPETARRVHQRIGSVLLWACAKGYRETEAPMLAIKKGLPKQPKRNSHFEAMPYGDVPAFLAQLRGTNNRTIGKLALEFLILTAARSGEVRGATWHEVDLDAATWTVPAERMKMGKEHIVPLSAAALDVLRRVKPFASLGDGLIFPGTRRGSPMSDMTLTKLLRDASLTATAHGFRSSFRDWAADKTDFPAEVAEAALAHSTGNSTVAAYKRTNFLEKRRPLMADWGSYCAGAGQ